MPTSMTPAFLYRPVFDIRFHSAQQLTFNHDEDLRVVQVRPTSVPPRLIFLFTFAASIRYRERNEVCSPLSYMSHCGLSPLDRNVMAYNPFVDSARSSVLLLPATIVVVRPVLMPSRRIFSRRAQRVFPAGGYQSKSSFVYQEWLIVLSYAGKRRRSVNVFCCWP